MKKFLAAAFLAAFALAVSTAIPNFSSPAEAAVKADSKKSSTKAKSAKKSKSVKNDKGGDKQASAGGPMGITCTIGGIGKVFGASTPKGCEQKAAKADTGKKSANAGNKKGSGKSKKS